jgi:hypothetical protein
MAAVAFAAVLALSAAPASAAVNTKPAKAQTASSTQQKTHHHARAKKHHRAARTATAQAPAAKK